MKRFLSILFGCLCLAAITIIPSSSLVSAHPGEHPHVKPAWYENKQIVNFDLDGDIGPNDTAEFRNAVQNIGGALSWPPQLYTRDCSNPGTCVRVHKIMAADDWSSLYDHVPDGPDHVWINVSDSPISQRRSCRTIVYGLGMHTHEDKGCRSSVYAKWTKLISFGEETRLDAAYCDALGCRPGVPIPNPEDYDNEELYDHEPLEP
jgi:hypothetical protein